MEQWKQSVLIGIVLIILMALFAIVKNEFNFIIILVIILGIAVVIMGLVRKKIE